MGSSPQLQAVLAVLPHRASLALARVRAAQFLPRMSVPGGRVSLGAGSALLSFGLHPFHSSTLRVSDVLPSRPWTAMKLCRDPSRRGPPNSGCLGSLSCLSRSILVWTSRLMPGGQIPASVYRTGKGVAFRLSVMVRQTLFSSTSTLGHGMTSLILQHSTQQWSSIKPMLSA